VESWDTSRDTPCDESGTRAGTKKKEEEGSTASAYTRAREKIQAFVDEHADVLAGCRNSLLDYLAERVDPDRWLAYAQTLVGSLQGTDEYMWMTADGGHYPVTGRAKIVAGALNELRQGDEVGRYFPGPPGDFGNLRAKTRYKVKAETGAERDARRSPPKSGHGKRQQPASTVSIQNQGDFGDGET